MAGRLTLAAVVCAAAIVGGLVFLNPWSGVIIAGGALAGWGIRRIIRSWPRSLFAGLKIAGIVFVLATVVLVVLVVLFRPGGPPPPGGSNVNVEADYRATVMYTPRYFVVREQFGLAPRSVRLIKGAFRGYRWRGVAALVRPLGWQAENLNGLTVVQRTRRTAHRSIRFWPARTALQLRTPRIHLGSTETLEPDQDSIVVIRDDKKAIASTEPAGEVTNGGKERTISLEDKGGFSPVSTIHVDVYSVWARNPVAQRLLGVSLSGLVLGFLGLVSALFSEEIKNGLRRLLHIGAN